MNKYPRRKPTRLKNHDYSQAGYYFVTVCTYNRIELFGKIEVDQMVLNQFGNIAQNAWLDLPNHHKNIKLDEYIVMPNHIHGIIKTIHVGNGPARSVNINEINDNLSIIIGSYKSAVTKQINRINPNPFKWQKSFHDHIIRDDYSIYKIREYIINNHATWYTDENNIENN